MLPSDLQFESSGSPIGSLAAYGTLAGVQIVAIDALNGPGQGLLAIDAAGNVTWTPPGGAAGAAVNVSAGGTFLVAGSDARQWLLVSVSASYLVLGSQAQVTLCEVYDSPLVYADVTSAQASAGNVQSWSIALKNTSATNAGAITLWLDPSIVSLPSGVSVQISANGTSYSAPTTQGTGLSLGTLAAGASVTIYFKRTITAGASPLAAGLVELHASWSTPISAEIGCRGCFRIFGPACYRIYRSNTTPPVPGSTPWATSPALPATPSATFADGTWYLSVSYFDGVYDSGFFPIGPAGEPYLTLVIASGVAAAVPPAAPQTLDLAESVPGVVRVTAVCAAGAAEGAGADHWSVSYTVNGGAATVVTYPYSQGPLAVLSTKLPAQSAGSVVAVTLTTRAGSVHSAALTASITLASGGPSAPLDANVLPDQES